MSEVPIHDLGDGKNGMLTTIMASEALRAAAIALENEIEAVANDYPLLFVDGIRFAIKYMRATASVTEAFESGMALKDIESIITGS